MHTARRLWSLYEPIHAVTYFSPQARAAAEAVGYRRFWTGYVAMRIAPLGAVGPEVATAAFYGFSPSRMRKILPDAWRAAPPERALEARLTGADRTLQAAWAPLGSAAGVAEAAELAEEAAQAADTPGRLLAAANAAQPFPDPAHLRLWQAATTLREHRGDGHNAALLAAGIGPVHAHVLKEAGGESEAGVLRASRGWTEEQWSAATSDLRKRGWLSDDGDLTDAGVAARGDVELRTDEAAAAPWSALGPGRTRRLAELLAPLAAAVLAAGAYRVPNPIGAPPPR
jgi:hypothetical protein